VYRDAGLPMRRRPRKRVAVERVPRSMPIGVNIRCSMDFVSAVVGDFSRACPVIAVDRSLPGGRVVRELDQVVLVCGCPEVIVCDNGPEFRGDLVHPVDPFRYSSASMAAGYHKRERSTSSRVG